MKRISNNEELKLSLINKAIIYKPAITELEFLDLVKLGVTAYTGKTEEESSTEIAFKEAEEQFNNYMLKNSILMDDTVPKQLRLWFVANEPLTEWENFKTNLYGQQN